MKTAQQILACMLFVALAIEEGWSNEVSPTPEPFFCHSCNSFTNPDCETITDDRYKVQCSANQTICRKVEQHMYYNKDDHVRVFRQCATRGTPGGCDSRTGTYRFKTWYCHCQGSLCNGSNSLLASVMLTVTLICASLGLRKCL
ncbi:unnamed protein product [Candidula unifasciata]|uniref:Protein sleepless n=1 Tax=Candidula unifasciata TaxID=100452 RepID=A0A8S3ZZ99_9EUPU|nr:unnamed protein product [Candidula unifasciata]